MLVGDTHIFRAQLGNGSEAGQKVHVDEASTLVQPRRHCEVVMREVAMNRPRMRQVWLSLADGGSR